MAPVADTAAVIAIVVLALVATLPQWLPAALAVLREELEAWRTRRDQRRKAWAARAAHRDMADVADELGRGGR